MIIDWIAGLIMLVGAVFVVIGAVGVMRMPDLYTRLHAASVTETLGAALVLIGLMVYTGWNLSTFKLFAILLFLLFTAPVASYALANAAIISGVKPELAPPGEPEAKP